jgi:hypothetical protein
MVFEITLTDKNSSCAIDKTLPPKNYEEGIAELATSVASDRLVARLIPTIRKDPKLISIQKTFELSTACGSQL